MNPKKIQETRDRIANLKHSFPMPSDANGFLTMADDALSQGRSHKAVFYITLARVFLNGESCERETIMDIIEGLDKKEE